MKRVLGVLATAMAITCPLQAHGKDALGNSLGMKLVRIEPGSFLMGQENSGDFDERPVHEVEIANPFFMSVTEVTNVEFERFRPGHRKNCGKPDDLSNGDDEAVVFVTWQDAVDFCKWLSDREGKPYRLPTEAEWEYASRAGTKTLYSTGDELPQNDWKNQEITTGPVKVSLKVAGNRPNPWGLYDMHGNVEEWCSDWYGPYADDRQIDPVGRLSGECRVTRGGSHSTLVKHLRSANRLGAIPEDRHWLLGFRVVIGKTPTGQPLPVTDTRLCLREVSQQKYDWPQKIDMDRPYFEGPSPFVRQVKNLDRIPMYDHNHLPSLTWCDNGDLLATWFSVRSKRAGGDGERGREMTILASRLRQGSNIWEEPSEFFKVPDRNMTGSALINDRQGRLYYFQGVSVAENWQINNILVMKTSENNGATWSRAKILNPDRGALPSQPIGSAYCTEDGRLILPSDWSESGMEGGATALWISEDRGENWRVPKGFIDGIHAAVVDLGPRDFMAFGRSSAADTMPRSITKDGGESWEYSLSDFPGIGGGRRCVLRRLQEGPLLLVSFTKKPTKKNPNTGMEMVDAAGKKRTVYGLYAALSFDDGKTWPIKKLLSSGGPARELDGGAWTDTFTMDDNHAEPMGYLTGLQTPDGVFHLVSSALHYQFNLAWLKEPMAPVKRRSAAQKRSNDGPAALIKTGKFRSPLLKRRVPFRVFAPERPDGKPMPTVVYVRNLAIQRTGTIPDSELISSFTTQGMLVVEVDYRGDARAKGADMYSDVMHLYRIFGADHGIDPEKRSFGPLMDDFIKWDEKRITTYRAFTSDRGAEYKIDPLWVYVIPEGFTIDRNIEVATIETNKRTVRHRMDLIHPASPEEPVPAVLEISTTMPSENLDLHTRINRNSCYAFTWTMAGYATAILDNVANHVTSVDIYGKQMTAPTGPHFPEKRALRLMRTRKDDWGLSGKVAVMGISKCNMRAIMSGLINGPETERFDAMISGGLPKRPEEFKMILDHLTQDDPALVWCQTTYPSRMDRPQYVVDLMAKEKFIREDVGKKCTALGLPSQVFFDTPIGHDFDYIHLRDIIDFLDPYLK